MDQLICASLSHTHQWYEVGMLKVPALGYIMKGAAIQVLLIVLLYCTAASLPVFAYEFLRGRGKSRSFNFLSGEHLSRSVAMEAVIRSKCFLLLWKFLE